MIVVYIKSFLTPYIFPAKAGIHTAQKIDSRFRGKDNKTIF